MENRPTSFDDIPLVLSVEELIPIFHVGRNTVYELVRSNQIRGIKVGKQIRVLKTDVLQFLGCQEPSVEAG